MRVSGTYWGSKTSCTPSRRRFDSARFECSSPRKKERKKNEKRRDERKKRRKKEETKDKKKTKEKRTKRKKRRKKKRRKKKRRKEERRKEEETKEMKTKEKKRRKERRDEKEETKRKKRRKEEERKGKREERKKRGRKKRGKEEERKRREERKKRGKEEERKGRERKGRREKRKKRVKEVESGLLVDKEVKNGLMVLKEAFSNVAAARPFDDLILRLAPRSSPNKSTTYFVQLKHIGKKPLALKTFVNDKNFLLKKYFEFFLKLRSWYQLASSHQPLDAEQRILCEGSLDDCRFDEGIHKMAHDILNTGEGQNCVLHFSQKDKVVWSHLNGDSNEKIYQQEFLPLLRLFCDQSTSDMLDSLITTEIKTVFGKSLPQLNLFYFQYLEFLKGWANNDGRNYCLTENSGEFEWIIAEHLRREARKISQMELLEFKVADVPAGIRAAKVLQLLEAEQQDSWIYVDSEVLRQYDLQALTAVCQAAHCRVLVLDVEVVRRKLKQLVLAVAGAVKVVDFGFCLLNATAGRVPFARVKDDPNLLLSNI
ncbi:Reticulocyte-binding protein 2 homolog a [Gryllus bimaculatus]|nr:Reticulocyte-binding protein 2 homolog a [Gryllus bimaculatus]